MRAEIRVKTRILEAGDRRCERRLPYQSGWIVKLDDRPPDPDNHKAIKYDYIRLNYIKASCNVDRCVGW